MNEQRAFTVTVTGCKNCKKANQSPTTYLTECGLAGTIALAQELGRMNYGAITPSCPMWSEAKPIGELK